MNQQLTLEDDKISCIVDPTLTPANARQKGYKYIDDIIYDATKPNENIKDILELINIHGYRLGSPSETNQINPYFGLYMPI